MSLCLDIKKIFLVCILSLVVFTGNLFAQRNAPIPEGEVVMIDDFEHGNYWIWAGSDWEKYGSYIFSCGADLSKKWSTEGRTSLELLMEATTQRKEGNWFYDGSQDLTGGRYIVADFYNPSTLGFTIAFVMQATGDWKWDSTDFYYLPPGEHTMVYNIEKYADDLSDVRRLIIFIAPMDGLPFDTSIFVDNIRLIK